MNWKKGLGLLVLLVALTSVLWLSRSSNDRHQPQSTDLSTASAPREHPAESSAASPRRPWEGVKPRPIAGPPVFPPKPAPQVLHVEWRGTWYPAEILSSSGSSNLIRYVGYGAEWDEWVTAERMRHQPLEKPIPQSFDSGADTVAAATEPLRRQPAPGDLVVKWGNRWWRAEILQTQGDNSFIRYVDYNSHSDEWVTPDRVKVFSPEDSLPPDPPAVTPQSSQELVVHGSPARGDPLVE